MDKILYKLDTFEGPLDLLLTLIQKNKVSIYDIPIVEITAQYLEAIDGIEEANLDNTSEFLVMASNLLYIKSKMLLPKNEEEEDEEDPREELSAYAPKAETMKIDVDKIREVIGQGGKVIQKIVAETGAKIDIEEDGTIHIFAVDQESGKAAKDAIEAIVKEPEVGEIYNGLVKTIQPFGAFVEILPGKDGLCHISKLANHRVEKVEDVVKEGDWLKVKVMEVDKKTGKISLSHKDAIEEGEE